MVVILMNAFCVLFGHEENWESSKKNLLNDFKFLEKLVKFIYFRLIWM